MVCVFVMAAKAPVVLAVKQSADLHCSFRQYAGLHGWRVKFVTHSELRIYNLIAKFDDRAGASPMHYPQQTRSHAQSIFSVFDAA